METPQEKKPSYDEAFQELERIMEGLQNDDISVDELTHKVKRASELIAHCNKMLRDTEKEVGDIIEELGI
ncbi:MAG: exodeoxyribonuclease VII small subunit [Cryomorphaceae bacterium]|nr:exodeoxyribonuclease VII small subunit [Cryomorphaceae bacterium]